MMKPEDINDRFERAYNAGDLDALMSLYEPNAIVVDRPQAPPVQGSNAIRESLSHFLRLGGRIGLVQRRFCVESEDLALISIEFELEGGRAPDGSPVNLSGVTVELVRRQADGSWKYVIDLPYGGGFSSAAR